MSQTSQDWANLLNWISQFGNDKRVLEWEALNPEPDDWNGMPHSYAYENMPNAKELK